MSKTTLQNGYYYGDATETGGGPVPNSGPPLIIGTGDTDVIAAGTSVFLGGTADNAGTLALEGSQAAAAYLIINGGPPGSNTTYDTTLTLQGGGVVFLDDEPDGNFVGENNAYNGAVLVNVNNTITGAGQFENFEYNNAVAIINEGEGVIDASGINQLSFTQSEIILPFINDGLMEATNTGGLLIGQQIDQSGGGTILAAGAGDDVLLQAADIIGGTLASSGGGAIHAVEASDGAASTFDGSTVDVHILSGTEVQVDDGGVIYLIGTIDNQGTVLVDGITTTTALDAAAVGVTLIGGGTVQLSDSTDSFLGRANDGTLTNVDNAITGAGFIAVNITNGSAGVIDGTGTLNALVLQYLTATNAGLVEATGTGGLQFLSATLDQSAGGTLAAIGTGNGVILYSADIIGGTLASSDGGVIHAVSGRNGGADNFDGSTVDVHILSGTDVQVDDGGGIDLFGTIDNQGTVLVDGITTTTALDAAAVGVTLIGGGTVQLSDSTDSFLGRANDGTLTNVDNAITGAGFIAVNITNGSAGVIDGTGTLNALVLQYLTAANAGLIEATGTGGLELFSATLDQSTGGTLAAIGHGNGVILQSADIVGGTLISSGGGAIHAVEGHNAVETFDGSTVDVRILSGTDVQVGDGGELDLLGTIDNQATIEMDGLTTATELNVAGVGVTLIGGGTVRLNETAGAYNVFGSVNYGTLINVDNKIAGAGVIYVGAGITNEAAGVIDGTGTLNALLLEYATVTNAGLVEATGTGGLEFFRVTLDQSAGGTLAAIGHGNGVILQSADIVGGTLISSGGGAIHAVEGHNAVETFDGSTVDVRILSGTDVQVGDGGELDLLGTIDNQATIEMDGLTTATELNVAGVGVTLIGGGTVRLNETAGAYNVFGSVNYGTLINVDNKIAGAGVIYVGAGITNEAAGVIDGTGTLNALLLEYATVTNAGLVEATGTGGLEFFRVTLDQSAGGTLAAIGSGNGVILEIADIVGGTLVSRDGGVIQAVEGHNAVVTFDGSTVDVHILSGTDVQVDDDAVIDLLGTIDNAGTIALAGTADSTYLVLTGSVEVLIGNGVVLLGGFENTFGYGVQGGTLVDDSNTIAGAGLLGGGADFYFVNQDTGVLDANSATGILDLNDGMFANVNGALFEATDGGTLDIFRLLTVGNTGTIAAFASSTVLFDGGSSLLNDAGGTLAFGTYEAIASDGTASLSIAGGQAVAVDAADIILSGARSVITTAGTTLEASLAEIAAGGTLQIDDRSYLSGQAIAVDAGGSVLLADASLGGGMTIDGLVFGFGTITTDIVNAGTVEADGGTLALAGKAAAAEGLLLIDPEAALELGAASANTAEFVAAGRFILDQATLYTGTIDGFTAGDTITLDGVLVDPADKTYAAGTGLVMTDAAGEQITLAISEGAGATAANFLITDQSGGTDITYMACFANGTRIATPSGEIPVEALAIGDPVVTADGRQTMIKWIGHRSYAGRFLTGNRNVLPILIRAGALADGVPVRDLSVSPKHAMFLDGALIPAERLVNGRSIVQREQVDTLTYFHIELDRHDILLADGAPAESFVDCDSRAMFQNAHEFAALYPHDDAPAWAFCTARVEDGELLAAVRRRIAARAGLVADHVDDAESEGPLDGRIDFLDHQSLAGWAFDATRPHTPMPIEILVDGSRIATTVANSFRADLRAAGKGDGHCAFDFRLEAPLSPQTDHHVQVRRQSDGALLAEIGLSADPRVPGPLEGRIDAADSARLEGWAMDRDWPGIAVRLEIVEDGRVIGSTVAARYRSDLAQAGLAEGRCSFSFRFDASAPPRTPHLVQVRRAADQAALPAMALAATRPRALFIDHAIPTPASDAGSQVVLSHMQAMQQLGYEVSFAAGPMRQPEDAPVPALACLDIACLTSAQMSVEEVLRREAGAFEVVYLHRVGSAACYASLVREHNPVSWIIYSVADLHHLRLQGQAALQADATIGRLAGRIKKQELAAAWMADAVITHSPVEASILRAEIPSAEIHVVPWSVAARPRATDFAERCGVAFIGGHAHAPNLDAASYLVREIMPLVHAMHPELPCFLVGDGMGEAAWHSLPPGIVPLGRVEDLSDVLARVRLTIAPLRFGAGIKGKVIDSFAAGVPCVMSPVAAQGLPLSPVLTSLIGDGASALAACVRRLHENKAPHAAAAFAGLGLVLQGFTEAATCKALLGAVKQRKSRHVKAA